MITCIFDRKNLKIILLADDPHEPKLLNEIEKRIITIDARHSMNPIPNEKPLLSSEGIQQSRDFQGNAILSISCLTRPGIAEISSLLRLEFGLSTDPTTGKTVIKNVKKDAELDDQWRKQEASSVQLKDKLTDNVDKSSVSKKISEPILPSFKENNKQSSKKRKSRDKEEAQTPVQQNNGAKRYSSNPMVSFR